MSRRTPSTGLRDAWLTSRERQTRSHEQRDDSRIVPPMLYLPVQELPNGTRLAEIRETLQGKRALLAFTALDRLFDGCGGQQPWVLVPTADLDAIQDAQPFDLIAFDPEIPQDLRGAGKLS